MSKNNTKVMTNHAKKTLKRVKAKPALPFTGILPDEWLEESIAGCEYRDRVFTPEMTIHAFLSQVISEDQSCQQTVAQVLAHLAQTKSGQALSASTSAYCQARGRLPEWVLSALAKKVGREVHEQVPDECKWRGRSIKLTDGTNTSMPDTAANQEVYPQSITQKEGAGFPLTRMVGVISLAGGALLDLAIAPWSGKGTGEHALLRQLMSAFEAGDIVLGDAYYASFFLVALLIERGVDVVFAAGSSRKRDFDAGRRLGQGDHIVDWKKPARPKWMDKETYARFAKTIEVRETRVVLEEPGFKTKTLVLVSTLKDEKAVNPRDLAELYGYRWFIEVDFRSIKTIMQMDVLRCKTPEMVRKEIWAHLLAYNLVRKAMLEAAIVHQRRPRDMSFKLTLQMMGAFLQAGVLSPENTQAYQRFQKAIISKTIGRQKRPSEPRMIKRRAKAFPRLQKSRHLYRENLA